MGTITIHVPEGIDPKIAKGFAKLVEERLRELAELDHLLKNSELTDEDIEEITKEIGARRGLSLRERIVVDTNVLFSFFKRESTTRRLIICHFNFFNDLCSEYLLEELRRYSELIQKKLESQKRSLIESSTASRSTFSSLSTPPMRTGLMLQWTSRQIQRM